MSLDKSELEALAIQLAGEDATVEPATHGGNSRVYRVATPSGKRYALKLYPQDVMRDRLGQESEALEFLALAGLGNVPRLVAQNRKHRAALLSWIEGAPVGERGPHDVEQLVQFLRDVHHAASRAEASRVRPATEAVLSGGELHAQLNARLEALREPAAAHRGLREVLEAIAAQAARHQADGWPELSREQQTLSPSDTGFHNALRRSDGDLAFVDFEYFGWDDPVKLVSDVLWHPGHRLDSRESVQFGALAAEIYSTSRDFEARFVAFYPLFGLRWALIVLNEFLRDGRERRAFAGMSGDRLETEERQLAKARDLVERVRACNP